MWLALFLGLLQVYCCKVGLNYCRIKKAVSTFFNRLKLTLDQSKIVSNVFFSANFQLSPMLFKTFWVSNLP